MRRWLLAVLLSVAVLPGSTEPWTTTQRALLAAALVAHAADWSQTRQIHAIDGVRERNPILGDKPSPGRVDAYFAATGIALAAASHYWPAYRTTVLGVWLSVELLAVGNNLALGIRVIP